MTNQPLITTLRYVGVIVGAIVAMLVALGYLAQGDADKIIALMEKLSEHGSAIIGIAGGLASIVGTAWGAYKSSNAAHVARIEQTPGVKLIVTNERTAPAAAVEAANDLTRPKVDVAQNAIRLDDYQP